MADLSRRRVLQAAPLGAGLAIAPGLFGGDDALARLLKRDEFAPWLEVSRAALRANAAAIASGAPLWACVKAQGFNLGEVNVARAIDDLPGVAGYMCTHPQEAQNLAKARLRKPILLMSPVDEDTAVRLAAQGVRLSITAKDTPESLSRIARRIGRPVPAHWEIDTGINRQGIPYWEAPARIQAIHASGAVKIEGTASYLAGGLQGETPPFAIDYKQIARFNDVVSALRAASVPIGARHMISSISYFHHPEAFYEGVRCGGLLYGGYPSEADEASGKLALRQSYAMKARLAQVTLVKAGEGVGYGQKTKIERDTWAGLLLLGGVTGYRPKPDRGGALINGRWRPLAAMTGTHSVYLLGETLDAKVGDEAIVLGPEERVRPDRVTLAGAWANYSFRPDITRVMVS